MWAIWMSADVFWPRTNAMGEAVNGDTKLRVINLQVPDLAIAVGCRARMSLRVSHPLRSASHQAAPNIPVRSYPVFGALPLMGMVSRSASAVVSVVVESLMTTDALSDGASTVEGSAGASSENFRVGLGEGVGVALGFGFALAV